MTVEGFRGIGAEATLHVQPGPGLTLIVGRNGSGKSSFAEAAELAVTGASRRWSPAWPRTLMSAPGRHAPLSADDGGT